MNNQTPEIATPPPSQTLGPESGIIGERPVPALVQRFAMLREKGIGKPIMVGAQGENGELTPESGYVGHVLPVNKNNDAHVVLFNDGRAIGIAQEPGGQQQYIVIKSSEPLHYPAGTTSEAIFTQMVKNPKRFGAIARENSDLDDHYRQKGIRDYIDAAMLLVAERDQMRLDLAKYTVASMDKALNLPGDTTSGSSPTATY